MAFGNIYREIPKRLIRAIFQKPAYTSKLEIEKNMASTAPKECFLDQNYVSYASLRSNLS